jgi:hypothetical protein
VRSKFGNQSPRVSYVTFNIALTQAKLGRLTTESLVKLENAAKDGDSNQGFISAIAIARYWYLMGQKNQFDHWIQRIGKIEKFPNVDFAYLQAVAKNSSPAELRAIASSGPFLDNLLIERSHRSWSSKTVK